MYVYRECLVAVVESSYDERQFPIVVEIPTFLGIGDRPGWERGQVTTAACGNDG